MYGHNKKMGVGVKVRQVKLLPPSPPSCVCLCMNAVSVAVHMLQHKCEGQKTGVTSCFPSAELGSLCFCCTVFPRLAALKTLLVTFLSLSPILP